MSTAPAASGKDVPASAGAPRDVGLGLKLPRGVRS